MKKIIIFLVIIICLFLAISLVTKKQNEEKAEEKTEEYPLYHKDTLHSETIEQLDDPNYQNIILPKDLDKKLKKKEDVTVYFFSPTCPHCVKATPVVMSVAEDLGIHVYEFNLLEFDDGWDDYNVEKTPTIIQYKKGKESARITGNNDREVFEQWFNENSK